MRKYTSIIKNQLNIALSYKFSLLAAFILPFIQVFISIFIWKVIYSDDSINISYDLNQMITYIVLAALISVVYSVSHAFRMTKLVKSGNLSFILIRPFNYMLESFSCYIGKKIPEAIILVFVFIVFNVVGVISIESVELIESVLLFSNFIFVFLFVNFIGMFSFRLIQMWTMKPLFIALVGLLGGSYFPLDILPNSIYKILKYNPFAFISYINVRVLIGKVEQNELIITLCVSIIWCIVFFIGNKILWHKGMKLYEGMGS